MYSIVRYSMVDYANRYVFLISRCTCPYLPLPYGPVLVSELPVAVPPLYDLRQWPGRESVHGAHDLEGGANLVVLVKQLAAETVHHSQNRSYKRIMAAYLKRNSYSTGMEQYNQI